MAVPAPRSRRPPPPGGCCRIVPPAIGVGVVCALILLGVSLLAEQLQDVLWESLPDALGVGRFSSLWMVAMLTATGLAVALVLRAVPGHGGPDPATTGLVDAPMRPGIVPGLLLVTVLALAGGVSLGPENPITAANIALAFWLGRRFAPGAPGEVWVALAAAGTIALFGTPGRRRAGPLRGAGLAAGPGRSGTGCWPRSRPVRRAR